MRNARSYMCQTTICYTDDRQNKPDHPELNLQPNSPWIDNVGCEMSIPKIRPEFDLNC